MKILYLDTSSSFLYTAIIDQEQLIGSVQERLDKSLSSLSLPKIKEMFEKTNITPQDIDRIIVVNGPGSFTGVRIGVTIAKTYAWSLKKEISTISSLEAMALSEKNYDYIIPAIDARRRACFAAIYNQAGECILKEQYIKIEELEKKVSKLEGSCIMMTNDEIDSTIPRKKYIPDILRIVNVAKKKTCQNPHGIEPDYLKRTEAEENKDHND